LLLGREPLVTTNSGHEGRPLISQDEHYRPEHEIREDPRPYVSFANAIIGADVLRGIDSVLNVGCATGRLLEALRPIRSSHLSLVGADLFSYHGSSQYFPRGVKFHQVDLRFPIESATQRIEPADLVICTEVGEHIDPASLDIFLENLAKVTRRRLVLTWSATYPPKGAPPQHVSPLSRRDVKKLMQAFGFEIDSKRTRTLRRELSREKNAYFWWMESLSVWSR
jgi:SAM-dependent methyltransferase